jgi:CheY-like chemotaxis protein/curved DNA-binding protein CbpA
MTWGVPSMTSSSKEHRISSNSFLFSEYSGELSNFGEILITRSCVSMAISYAVTENLSFDKSAAAPLSASVIASFLLATSLLTRATSSPVTWSSLSADFTSVHFGPHDKVIAANVKAAQSSAIDRVPALKFLFIERTAISLWIDSVRDGTLVWVSMVEQQTARPVVLIVEDNEDVRRVVKLYLESHEYRVVEAGDGLAGLAAFEAEHPDLILFDVLLPRLDGIEALKRLRSNPLGRDVPVIVMSAVLQTKDLIAETAQLKVAGLLQKPFQVRRLLEEVRRVLSGGGQGKKINRESASALPSFPAPAAATDEKIERIRNAPLAICAVGQLEKTPLPKVLHSLFVSNRTGRLRVVSGTTEKRIYVSSGLPVYAESSIPEETLGAYLVALSKITEEQHKKACIEMTAMGRHYGEALLKLGIITPHDLFTEMEHHLAEKIVSTFAWKRGLFKFEDDESWKDDVVIARMKPGRILLDGITRYWKEDEILSSERFNLSSKCFLVEDVPYTEEQMALTSAEQKLLQLVRHNPSIGDIRTQSGMGPFTIAPLYAMFVMERIGFSLPVNDAPLAALPAASLASASSTPLRAGATSPSKEELAQALLAEYLKLRTVDYFTLLGVPRDATCEQIDAAFALRQKRYHPDNLIGIDAGLVQEKMEELFVRVHTAHQTLTDDSLRTRYIEEMDQGAKRTMLTQRSKTGKFETLSNKPRHELLFEDGFSLLRNGEFSRALDMFKEAESLVSKARYSAYRAWCSYLVNSKQRESVERELLGLVKQNVDDSIMVYLLGNFYLREGNEKRATTCFEKVLEIDSQNIDAARQLRIIRMRQRQKNSEVSGLFDLFKKS